MSHSVHTRAWNLVVLGPSLAMLLAAGCGNGVSGRAFDVLPEGQTDTASWDSIKSDSAEDEVFLPTDPGKNAEDPGSPWDPGLSDAGLAGFDEPCVENEDCDSELCVLTWNGYRCAPRCIENCPEGSSCRLVPGLGQDPQNYCVPDFMTSCNPCERSEDCQGSNLLSPGAICMDVFAADESLAGRFCAEPCREGRCPSGFTCSTIEVGGEDKDYCLWDQNGGQLCECHGLAIQNELETTCSLKNELGECSGRRACGPQGLGQCNAATAESETCNGLDDNCDGTTDEGFPDCDSDGKADCVDPDLDGDGVLEDGDGSGVIGDNPCSDGVTEGCDDNCPTCGFANPGQADSNSDGFGDMCDPCLTDADEDGFGQCEDCDDGNSAIHPDAVEKCDGKDNNCDERIDEDLGSTTCGLGVCNHTVSNCVDGLSQECDPFEGQGGEVCDEKDNDCDGSTDEELGTTTCGLGVCNHTVPNCLNGVAQTCDPFDGRGTEVCDNKDNDCDGSTDEDLGTTTCGLGVCNHTVSNCVNGVPQTCDPFEGNGVEVCDDKDNDCDGGTDEDLGSTTCGLGVCNHTVSNCVNGVAQTCDPLEGKGVEACDNKDNDCDGSTDEDLTQACSSTCGSGVETCSKGSWGGCTAPQPISCTDYNTCGQFMSCSPCPSAPPEVCNGRDDDCDGSTDEGVKHTYYRDLDADGQGASSSGTTQACSPPIGYSTSSADCDDGDPYRYLGAREVWDIRDNDCDGQQDEDGLNRFNRYYKPWTANDWEHRFSQTSLPGYEYDNHYVILYPTNVCGHATYQPEDTCYVRDGGSWIELWAGTLIAMAECRGILGVKHVSLYLSELSGEYADYKNGGILSCQRIGYFFGPSSCSNFAASAQFYRHSSGFADPGKGDVMWSTDPSEGHPTYDSHVISWCAPGGY